MTIKMLKVKRALAAVLGSVALTAGCSATAEGDHGSGAVEQSVTGTPTGTSTTDTEVDPSEAIPAREMIGNKVILSAEELVDVYNTDPPDAFEDYFRLRPEDFNMTPLEIYEDPDRFAELYAQMAGRLNSTVLELPALLYPMGGYNGTNSLPQGVTREQYNENFRADAAAVLYLSRHCRDHVDDPTKYEIGAFDFLDAIYGSTVEIVEGYSGLAETVDVQLGFVPYEVSVNGQAVRVVLKTQEGSAVSFPGTSHPGFAIATSAEQGNTLTTSHVGYDPESGTLVLGDFEDVPPLIQQ